MDITGNPIVRSDLHGMVYDAAASGLPAAASRAVRIPGEQGVCDDQFVGELLDSGHRNDSDVLSHLSRGGSARAIAIQVCCIILKYRGIKRKLNPNWEI